MRSIAILAFLAFAGCSPPGRSITTTESSAAPEPTTAASLTPLRKKIVALQKEIDVLQNEVAALKAPEYWLYDAHGVRQWRVGTSPDKKNMVEVEPGFWMHYRANSSYSVGLYTPDATMYFAGPGCTGPAFISAFDSQTPNSIFSWEGWSMKITKENPFVTGQHVQSYRGNNGECYSISSNLNGYAFTTTFPSYIVETPASVRAYAPPMPSEYSPSHTLTTLRDVRLALIEIMKATENLERNIELVQEGRETHEYWIYDANGKQKWRVGSSPDKISKFEIEPGVWLPYRSIVDAVPYPGGSFTLSSPNVSQVYFSGPDCTGTQYVGSLYGGAYYDTIYFWAGWAMKATKDTPFLLNHPVGSSRYFLHGACYIESYMHGYAVADTYQATYVIETPAYIK